MRLKQTLCMGCLAVLMGCTAPIPIESGSIVLQVQRSGLLNTYATYMIDPSGSDETGGALPQGLKDQAEWSPDRQWIAYSTLFSNSRPDASDVYIMRADGSQHIRITERNQSGSFDPAWSPDGVRLAYFAYDGIDGKAGLYVVEVSCMMREESCEAVPRYLVSGRTPDWSPDGTRIAYQAAFGDEIYVINSDGMGETKDITPPGLLASCHDPKWSPSGTQIAVSCYRQRAETFSIYSISVDSWEAIRLTDGGFDMMPRWSPDGSQIAFVSRRDDLGQCIGGLCGSGGIYSTALFLMNADGSNIQRLSTRNDEEIVAYTWLR